MEKKAGPNAQIWCRTPLTHWMCSGYRFDLLDEMKVEGQCSCYCHRAGEFKAGSLSEAFHGTSHGICMADNPERFEQARLLTVQLYEKRGLR